MPPRNTPLLSQIPRTGNQLPFDRGDLLASVPARFETVVTQVANRIAVEDGICQFTYQELNNLANKVAQKILGLQGQQSNQHNGVAILLGHNVKAIIAILGVLKAGGFFTIILSDLPAERISFLLSDSRAKILISDSHQLHLVDENISLPSDLIVLDDLDPDEMYPNPEFQIEARGLSNLIYTSGSTGTPKGVIMTHQNLLHAAWRNWHNLSLNPTDRVAMTFYLSFGGAMLYSFGTLLNGGTLCLFDIKAQGLKELVTWFQEKKIAFCQITPTTLRQLVQYLNVGENFPHLRLILTGGEPIRTTDIQLFKEYFSKNSYLRLGGGTSEALVYAECFITYDNQLSKLGVPMGFSIPDKEIFIWDENQNLLPEGTIGEIIVKSRYLTAGYWGHSELNSELFFEDQDDHEIRGYKTGDLGLLKDGVLYHRGRRDHQIKVRGYRVELGEIESVLMRIPEILTGVVVGRPNHYGDTQLVTYIVLKESAQLSISEVRDHIAQKLPDYMVPSRFIFLKNLPVTTAGKISYADLPDPGTGRPTLDNPLVPPVSELEIQIAEIWSDVLGISEIGVRDNFLEMGGHSLLATQIVNRVQEKMGAVITLSQFFAAQTISGLVAIMTEFNTTQPAIRSAPQKIEPVSRDRYRNSSI
jgi:amino acid adenylation domain-containing protein